MKWQDGEFIFASQCINFSLLAPLLPLTPAFQNFKNPDKTTRKLPVPYKTESVFKVYAESINCKYFSRAIHMLVFLTKGRKSLKFGKGGIADTANSDPEQSLLFCSQRVSMSFLLLFSFVCWMATAVLKEEN